MYHPLLVRRTLLALLFMTAASTSLLLAVGDNGGPKWKELWLTEVVIEGAIKRAGTYHPAMADGKFVNLRQLIASAGGFTAQRVEVRIVRPKSDSAGLVWEATYNATDSVHQLDLRPGDMIHVYEIKGRD